MLLHYMKIDCSNGDDDESDGLVSVSTFIFKAIHGQIRNFAEVDGYQGFGLGFPKIGHFEIFSYEKDRLTLLRVALSRIAAVRDFSMIHLVKSVGITPDMKMTEYARFRIPNNLSIGEYGGSYYERNLNRRVRRLQHKNDTRMPYFMVMSGSNGNLAKVFIEARHWDKGISKIKSDSWGLSTEKHRFGLPVL